MSRTGRGRQARSAKTQTDAPDDEQAPISLLMFQHGETPKALRMSPNGRRKHRVWLPKSQISLASLSEKIHTVTMPYWLAERADLLQFLSMDDGGKFVRAGQPLWTGARKLDFE